MEVISILWSNAALENVKPEFSLLFNLYHVPHCGNLRNAIILLSSVIACNYVQLPHRCLSCLHHHLTPLFALSNRANTALFNSPNTHFLLSPQDIPEVQKVLRDVEVVSCCRRVEQHTPSSSGQSAALWSLKCNTHTLLSWRLGRFKMFT